MSVTSPEIMIKKKNVIFDSQLLSAVMSCGRYTDFRFNHNFIPIGGKSVNLEMGSIVHAILESYYKQIRNGFRRDQAIGTALIAGREYITLSGEVNNCSSEDIETCFNTAEQYFEYYKNDFWTTLEVEHVKGKVLYEDDEIRILYKAKYDWIVDTNVGIHPVDHKTMKMRRDTLTLDNQFMGQCILCETRMMYVNKVGFQKTLAPKDKFVRDPVHYSLDRLQEWQSVILPYWGKIYLMYQEGNYWPPNFKHCENKYGFCEYKEVCEADRGMREEILRINFKIGEPWDVTNV